MIFIIGVLSGIAYIGHKHLSKPKTIIVKRRNVIEELNKIYDDLYKIHYKDTIYLKALSKKHKQILINLECLKEYSKNNNIEYELIEVC